LRHKYLIKPSEKRTQMKIFFLILTFIIINFLGFSQSFLVDSKSLSVPRYANQAAINMAIPIPTEGMLVFNNALDQFAYHTGLAWVNFPSAGGGGTTFTTHVPINTYANTTVINAIASPVEGMMVFNSATNEIFFRGASAWTALPFTNNPWVISGNNISFTNAGVVVANGALASSSGTTYGIRGTASDTDASPALHVQNLNGNINEIRYDGGNNTNVIEQTYTQNITPANASMEWTHQQLATSVSTDMMTLQGDGDLTINGFMGFGEAINTTVQSNLVPATNITVTNPAVKMKLLTGSITASPTVVAFGGIDPAKIVSVRGMVYRSNTSPQQYITPGAEVSGTSITGSYSLTFTTNPASSGSAGFKFYVPSNWVNATNPTATYKLYVLYTE
jgi:hypothetical protein